MSLRHYVFAGLALVALVLTSGCGSCHKCKPACCAPACNYPPPCAPACCPTPACCPPGGAPVASAAFSVGAAPAGGPGCCGR